MLLVVFPVVKDTCFGTITCPETSRTLLACDRLYATRLTRLCLGNDECLHSPVGAFDCILSQGYTDFSITYRCVNIFVQHHHWLVLDKQFDHLNTIHYGSIIYRIVLAEIQNILLFHLETLFGIGALLQQVFCHVELIWINRHGQIRVCSFFPVSYSSFTISRSPLLHASAKELYRFFAMMAVNSCTLVFECLINMLTISTSPRNTAYINVLMSFGELPKRMSAPFARIFLLPAHYFFNIFFLSGGCIKFMVAVVTRVFDNVGL